MEDIRVPMLRAYGKLPTIKEARELAMLTHDWTLDDHICWEKNCNTLYHGDGVTETAHEQMAVHMREAHNIAMPEKCAGRDCPNSLPF